MNPPAQLRGHNAVLDLSCAFPDQRPDHPYLVTHWLEACCEGPDPSLNPNRRALAPAEPSVGQLTFDGRLNYLIPGVQGHLRCPS